MAKTKKDAPKRTTKEKQNQVQVNEYHENGPAQLGPWTSYIWRHDPRHLGFLLARYKFCAKMLAGKGAVLEVGCGDAVGTPVVLQSVKRIHGIDFEPLVLEDIKARMDKKFLQRCTFEILDVTKSKPKGSFDAAFSLDVIEHIPPKLEDIFMKNLVSALKRDAVCILGTPNKDSSRHASTASKAGHVNLKTAETMKQTLAKHFANVFVFSMNDEMVHTGFYPMAHYILGVGVGKKRA